MPKIKKTQLLLEDILEDFMINCTNKDLSRKTMMAYEKTLRLFFKYLEEEFNIIEIEKVDEWHIKGYLDFTKNRGKYSFVSDLELSKLNKPQNRKDFGKEDRYVFYSNTMQKIHYFQVLKIRSYKLQTWKEM